MTCRFTQAGGGIVLLSLSGFLEFSFVETPFQVNPKQNWVFEVHALDFQKVVQ